MTTQSTVSDQATTNGDRQAGSAYLNVSPLWKPDPALAGADGTFEIRELVAAAVGTAP